MIGNGATAILAGVVAQVLEDSFGHIGPFQGILRWDENFGETKGAKKEGSSLYRQFTDGVGRGI